MLITHLYAIFIHTISIQFNPIHSEMTEFLVILTQAARKKDQHPYLTEKDYDGKMNRIPKTAPLYMWAPADWKNFRSCLTKIQGSMLRCDANASVSDIIINSDNNKSVETRRIDPFRSVSPIRIPIPWCFISVHITHKMICTVKNVLSWFLGRPMVYRQTTERTHTLHVP